MTSNTPSVLRCACGADMRSITVDSSRGISHGGCLNVRVEWDCLNHHGFVDFVPAREAQKLIQKVAAERGL